MAHRCIHRVHFSTGSDRKVFFIPKSASSKFAADKFDTYVSMFIMNYPSLSVLKCIRHFLRSLFWFSRIMPWLYPDIDMAASAGTSAEKHGCAKAVVVDCLFCLSAPSDSKQIPLFPLQVFDMPCRTAQHECTRIDLRVVSDLSLRVLGRMVPGRRVT